MIHHNGFLLATMDISYFNLGGESVGNSETLDYVRNEMGRLLNERRITIRAKAEEKDHIGVQDQGLCQRNYFDCFSRRVLIQSEQRTKKR